MALAGGSRTSVLMQMAVETHEVPDTSSPLPRYVINSGGEPSWLSI